MPDRKGFSLKGLSIVIVILIIPVMIERLLRSLGESRELAKRNICMLNLKGVGIAIRIYANENDGLRPIAPHDPMGGVRYVGAVGKRGSAAGAGVKDSTIKDREVSTTQCLWILVREGGTSSVSFWCPSSRDEPDLTKQVSRYFDFTGYNTVSYGYQVPFGPANATARVTTLAQLLSPAQRRARASEHVLAADKGPFSQAGPRIGVSPSGRLGLADAVVRPGGADPRAGAPRAALEPFNSPNHGGEGQNVLYGDAHADWTVTQWHDTPEAGSGGDNIYTRGPTKPGTLGEAPTADEAPGPGNDALIYP